MLVMNPFSKNLVGYARIVILKGLVPLVFDSERNKAMSYAFATNSFRYVLAIKTPTDSMSYMAYIDPITVLAWTSLGIFCLISPIFLTIVSR